MRKIILCFCLLMVGCTSLSKINNQIKGKEVTVNIKTLSPISNQNILIAPLEDNGSISTSRINSLWEFLFTTSGNNTDITKIKEKDVKYIFMWGKQNTIIEKYYFTQTTFFADLKYVNDMFDPKAKNKHKNKKMTDYLSLLEIRIKASHLTDDEIHNYSLMIFKHIPLFSNTEMTFKCSGKTLEDTICSPQ